ncbi:phosphotransferase family protein [Streptomyces sp. NPDC091972]|uniref:phosphotransferase family protein n=1 Tax=Streptomyces sp. NPDC091972 TaxID=3366007 RepID=UPI0037F46C6D
MTATRRHLTRTDLAPLARAATGRTLTGVTRLRGGTSKGVYRLALDDGGSVVAYVWSADEDYWDSGPGDPRDPFSSGTGRDVFTAAHDRLVAAGVRTSRLLHTDTGRDAVVVEDLRGGSLEQALERDPALGRAALERLVGELAALHAQRGPAFGKVGLVDGGGTSAAVSAARRVTDGALRDIARAAARDGRIAAVREEAEEAVRRLAEAVRPRDRHVLVHGELGPDHVLLDDRGRPALIDVEGLMYFDVEWEHVFLRIRFGPHYDVLRAPGLDEDRLRLYRLAMHLSLVAGPLRLIEGDFPNPGWMREIAEHNLGEVLTLLRSAS